MKWDMGGAGAVVGAFKALALRKAKANVVGICGLVENMPGGNAQRPGDVVTTMSGQTVEVINTDAEGRLVLADAVTYVQRNYKPSTIIDLATLTGAIWSASATNGPDCSRMMKTLPQSCRRSAKNPATSCGACRWPSLRQVDRFPDRRHEERWPARRWLDHRRTIHPALHREWRQMGAYRHGRQGVVGQSRQRPTTKARPALACGCSTNMLRTCWRPERERAVQVDFYQLGGTAAEQVIASIAEKVLGGGRAAADRRRRRGASRPAGSNAARHWFDKLPASRNCGRNG